MPTANGVLQHLVAEGIVELARGRIVITEPAALAKRAR
jgi:hypothetical protein